MLKLRGYLCLLVLLLGAAPAVNAGAQGKESYMLAISDDGGNIAIYDSNGKNPFPLTNDAQPDAKLYQWPTWSTDGRLAYFGANAAPPDPYLLRVFVVDQVKAGAAVKVAFSSTADVFTYAYWSPGDCLKGNCRDLALLYTPPGGNDLGLRLIRDNNGAFTDKVVGSAAPFYYSFAPDGQQMLWYQNTQQLQIYDAAVDKIVQALADTPGKFNAPMWSPVDDRLLFGVANPDGETTDLVIAQGADRKVLIDQLDGPVAFAWSPDGTKVASTADFSRLTVTDATSGSTLATVAERNIVAHFWSPQSDRIAYIVLTRAAPGSTARIRSNGRLPLEQTSGSLKWYILDVKSGKSTAIATFLPSRDMVYLLNFFDQFARSHSLWSPDGRWLTYASTDAAGNDNVMIVDTRQAGSNPVRVSGGTIGIWSWK